jgi:hypothetical protein
MEPKHLYPVVEFIVAATGLGPKAARKLLGDVPEDRYGQIFMATNMWKAETRSKAAQEFQRVLGDVPLNMLIEATTDAAKTSTEQIAATRKARGRRGR